jgi:molybdopterin converting factor small subunit
LNNQYCGITFRIIDEQGKIRPHIKIFINTEQIYSTNNAVKAGDEIHIITALSGG